MPASRRLLLPLLTGQVLLLALWAALRLVNADEGILLEAARRVGEGARLYRDVFFMHPPFTAYAFAPFAGTGWAGFYAARGLGGLAATALVATVGRAAYRTMPDRRAAVLAAALVGLNGLTLAWHPTATTLVWGPLFGALGLFRLTGGARTARRVFGAGVWLGLAACARLPEAMLGVAALVWVLGAPGRGRLAGALIAGGLVGIAPALVHLALDPAAFWLDVVMFRQVWGADVVAMPLSGTLKAFGQFVLYPQNLLVLGLFGWSGVRLRRADTEAWRAWRLYALGAGLLAALYLAVTPTQTHYFAETLPVLAAGAAPALAHATRGWTRRRLGLAVALYALCVLPYAFLFLGGQRPKDRRYRLATVVAVTRLLDRCTASTDTVLSFNQHAPVLAARPAAPGLAVGGVAVVPRLTPADRRRAGLYDEAALRAVLAAGRYRAVVYEPTFFDEGPAPLAAHYRRVFGQDSVAVYLRRDVACRP